MNYYIQAKSESMSRWQGISINDGSVSLEVNRIYMSYWPTRQEAEVACRALASKIPGFKFRVTRA